MVDDVKLFVNLRERWSSVSPAVRLATAGFVIIAGAWVALWLVDKVFIYVLAHSYVEDVADVLDLNEHLARAISLVVFISAAYFAGKALSLSRASRRIGYLGILALLIGHSLLLWKGTKDQKFTTSGKSIKCYVLTHEGDVLIREQPGIDPITGRSCRPVTPDVVYLLEEYKKGRRPQRITSGEPTFFDPRSGEPSVWYSKDKDGVVEIFNLMGFHPETGSELLPITPDVADLWKAQNERREAEKFRRPPQRIEDPENYAFFDSLTGKPRVWYWRGPNGEYEFYDNPGFHPRTGEALTVITSEAIASWKDSMKQKQLEKRRRAAEQERERQATLEKQQQEEADRLEQQQLEGQRRAAEQEREQQAVSSCDQMAANPADVRKPADVSGAPYDVLKANSKAAVEACALAVKVNPGEIRYRYQYARSLEIDDPRRAFKIHEQLIHDGYLASYDNAGSILIGTYKNIPEGIKYFKEGARRGDPDSMVSLASLIEQHYVVENNPEAARYVLLSKAAKLGHPGAQLALEKEREKFQELQQQRQFQQQQQQLMLQMLGTIMQAVPRH